MLSMYLDVRTLLIVMGAICFLVSGALLFFQARQFRMDGVREWSAGHVFQGISWIFLGLRGIIPDVLSIVVANTLLTASYSLLFAAVREFQHRSYRRDLLFAPAMITFVFVLFFWIVIDNIFLRFVYTSLLCAMQMGFIALILFREGPFRVRRSQWLTGSFFAAGALLWFARLIQVLVFPYQRTQFLELSIVLTALLFLGFGVVVLSSVGYLLMIRERAGQELKESEEKYRAILENIEDGYHEVDLDGRLTFFNESFRKMLGYPAGELLGVHYNVYAVDEEATRKVYQAYNRIYRTGEPLQGFEWDVVRKDGSRRSAEVTTSLIRDLSGRPIGFRGIVRDITERKAAEDAINEQLHFLQILMDAIPNPLFYKDREGRYQGCNKAFEEYLGLGKPEIVGRTVYEVAPRELAQTYHKMDMDLLERSGTQVYESRVKYADGKIHDVIFNKATYHRKDGSVAGLIGVILDISKRKQAEDALRESEERWQFALEGAGDGLWDWNAQTNKVYYSRQWKTMLGFNEEEIGESLDEWDKRIHPDDRDDVYAEINRHFEGKSPIYISEHRVRCKDSTYKWILDRGKVIGRTPEGKPLRVIGTHSDITERKQLEAQLLEARKMEAIGKLASGAAHEIRNPLNIMSLWLQMLDVTGKAADDDVRKAIDTCNAQIRRIIHILEGLQEFASIPETRKTPNDLNKIIEEVAASQDERLRSEGIIPEIRYGEKIPPFMLDKDKIAMVITHLISNAVDAMKGRETKRLGISIHRTPTGERVRILVSDTGHGIKEADKARIFDPFFTTKDPDKGKGLGLSVSYGIIHDHGGTIRAENNEQGGATFIIELPV